MQGFAFCSFWRHEKARAWLFSFPEQNLYKKPKIGAQNEDFEQANMRKDILFSWLSA